MARPKEFDEQVAVAEAMDLFWERGFGAASLDALEAKTGLNRSSLYNTFGGKVELFCKALDAYREGPCRQLHLPLKEREGAEALRGYLQGLRSFVRSREVRNGCLMVNTGLEPGLEEEPRKRVEAHFKALRADFFRAYQIGVAAGKVNQELTPREAADWLLTMVRGVLVGAVSGETVTALERSIQTTSKYLGLEPV